MTQEHRRLRPAIIVGTSLSCRLPNSLALVVPCTSTLRDLDAHPRVQLAQPGAAMCDQLKSVSRDRLVWLLPHTLTGTEIVRIKFVLRQLVAVD
ncbi:type II toxin-antitoxin system PemK/MazF family toxin [Sporichthya sp.]|uniref:type II toxin-antitoxin system PemK/MazF family toxin n=1 Tax=Sporichthya sp. TaxID=65475 RepID=UPI0017CC637E|nr:type II toxin-antitoxin system PemK/MazF family toxin [Sporichthya sp.]MBA3744261.1 type II toxin-antitoxin system PemK/MazF family toxin [Sporichthya sp.]